MRLYLLVSLFVLLLGPFFARAEERLTILHTSEHHGTLQPIEEGPYKGLGGVARRAGLIEKIRQGAQNVLLVDSGDLVIGTAMSSVFRGAPDIAAMSLMGYDALGLGNHDFDFGLEHLKDLQRQARFPFLCTNIRPKQAGVCQPYAVKTVGRLRVGILGLIGRKNYPDSFDRGTVSQLEFQDPLAAAAEAAKELRGRVDLLVAVTHEETIEDLALAKAVPEIDVIVGGHTPGFDGLIPAGGDIPVQGRVAPPPRGPIFVKSHQQARTLGRLDLAVDGHIRAAEAQNIAIDASLPEEPRIAALVQDYAGRLDSETNRVLGRLQVDLQGDAAAVRSRETNFGDLLADLARGRAGTEIAVINGGAIRGSIPAGPVTLKQIMRSLPYNDPLISVKLTGAEVRNALENSVSQVPQSGRFLQVSGFSYLFDAAAPRGSRVKEIRVQGVPLAADREYSVVANRFIAEGGDAYTMFLQAPDKVEHQTTLRDLFSQALEKGPVTAKEEGRVRQK